MPILSQPQLLSSLRAALGPLALGLLLRSLPFFVYSAVGRRLPVVGRIVSLALGASLFGAAIFESKTARLPALSVAVVGVWFIAATSVLHAVTTRISGKQARSFIVFSAGVALYLIAPAIASQYGYFLPKNRAPSPLVGSFVAAFGWEAAMRAHSYAVWVAGSKDRRSLSSTLFHLLVDPNVVPCTTVKVEDPKARDVLSVLRVCAGSVTMLGRDVVIVLLSMRMWLRWGDVRSVTTPLGYAEFVAAQLLAATGLYAAHSGLASFQIGWMRLLGFKLPERYRFPVLSTSPQDFWSRWNTWIGEWAKRYVFVPCTLWSMRKWGGTTGATLGALAAFVFIGIYHDVGIAVMAWGPGSHAIPFRLTLIFAAFGIVLVAWRECAKRVSPILARVPARLLAVGSWCLAINVVAWLAWLAVSVLRTHLFPAVIEHLFVVRT